MRERRTNKRRQGQKARERKKERDPVRRKKKEREAGDIKERGKRDF